ncbi:MAG: hypothetical protein P4L50_13555 [Anaerolineaceae bacterium]|nr:hypothetical protein [Anaerolineaceae bacterium]
MNFPILSRLGDFFNFLFGLPPYILLPVLVIGGYLIIRGVVRFIFAQAKSAAGAIVILLLVSFVCLGGFFIFFKMPNILSALDKLFYPILHL